MKLPVLWQAVVSQGFCRLEANSDGQYREFPTYLRDGVLLAFCSESIHFYKGRVTRFDAAGCNEITLCALIVDKGSRRQGKARAALGDFLKLTDERGMKVYLEPVCMEPTYPLPKEVLESFYASFGFAWEDESKKVMSRSV
jgi:GNAT superfamily N-acetyltransferase